MRNLQIIAGVFIVAFLLGCQSDDFETVNTDSRIVLDITMPKDYLNKAAEVKGTRGLSYDHVDDLTSIGLFGIKTTNGVSFATGKTGDYIHNIEVASAGTSLTGWPTEHSWPGGQFDVALFAYAPYATGPTGNGITVTTGSAAGAPELNYTAPSNVSLHPDIIVAKATGIKGDRELPYPMTLTHICARVVIGGFNKQVSYIKLYYVYDQGTYNFDTGWVSSSIKASEPNLVFSRSFTYPFDETDSDGPDGMTFFLPPQTTKEGAMIEIQFADGTNKVLDISGAQWKEGETYNYYFSEMVTDVDYSYIGCRQAYLATVSGTYSIECWGAQGSSTGRINNYGTWPIGGKGGYTYGEIHLDKGEPLFVYVGQEGGYNNTTIYRTYNGGGNGMITPWEPCTSGRGGGATDVRLVSGAWSSFKSLKSRIMVAAGGGGAGNYNTMSGTTGSGHGGNGGGLVGGNGTYAWVSSTYSAATANSRATAATGGTQTSGGYPWRWDGAVINDTRNGSFGFGGTRAITGSYFPGGGGGYYGGATGGANTRIVASASGGSSFISGHTGCDAITSSSTIDNIIHTNQPNHYSGKIFSNTNMISGGTNMPITTTATGTESAGHAGNGYCRIRLLSAD